MLLFFGATAQITQTGTPFYFENELPKNISTVETPTFDVQALLDEDAQESMLKPYRFAKVFSVELNFKENATLQQLDNKNVWTLKIKSENAKSIGLIFSNFNLPENSRLFIYDSKKEYLLGAITSANNKENGILPTTHIPADEIIIEYSEDANSKLEADFTVSQISHDYRGAFSGKDSQWCEVNINCSEGDDWQTVKHSVCKYTYTSGGSSYVCSGALVANTQNTSTPYFLTANHCVSTQDEASSAVFYFNYEADNCDGTYGPTDQTISGATLRATANNSLDFSLLEMSSIPPQAYEPYYAGWSRSTTEPSNTTCIHHPSGDIKKISKDYDAATTGSFDGYDDNKHWEIAAWDVGTTEGGSSGSPLFNANQQIVGDLSGGAASCDNNVLDYYQKFSHSWDDYTSSSQNLKSWLDPSGSNPTEYSGYDPYNTSSLPAPEALNYQIQNENDVILNWFEPGGSAIGAYTDGFESYTDFSLTFANWTQYDNDGSETWGAEDFDYTNEGYTGAFMVFNSSSCSPANPSGWEAHSGTKFLACFDAQNPPNDDWLVSPAITIPNQTNLSFWAKSVTDQYGLERIRVGVSTTNTDPSSFTIISEGSYVEVPTEWTNYTYELKSYIGQEIYIAINVVSDDAFCLFIDDFDVSSYITVKDYEQKTEGKNTSNRVEANSNVVADLSPKSVTGYKLYRENELYQDFSNSTTKTFTDAGLKDGIYNYYVTAIYTGDEESMISNRVRAFIGVSVRELDNAGIKIFPNPSNGVVNLSFDDNLGKSEISIYNCEGKLFDSFSQNLQQKNQLDLSQYKAGVYILEIRNETNYYKTKLIIK